MTERALTESQQRFAELPGLHVLTDAPASSFPSGARELRLGTPTGGGTAEPQLPSSPPPTLTSSCPDRGGNVRARKETRPATESAHKERKRRGREKPCER